MSELNLQVLVQAGAVGLCVLLIFYIAWKDKIFNKTINNHLQHFTDAINGNSKVIARNSEAIGRNSETNKTVARLLNRVEDKLDRS